MSVLPIAPMAVSAPLEQQRERGASLDEMRKMSRSGAHPGIRQRLWGQQARLDPNVTFEEYTYWAKIEREMEEEEYRQHHQHTTHKGFGGAIKAYFTSNLYEETKRHVAENNVGGVIDTQSSTEPAVSDEKRATESSATGDRPTTTDSDSMEAVGPSQTHDFDAEWRTASRALRSAGWGSVFYLITTDILGWGATPNVFAQTGISIGTGIFVLMGLAAGASGIMIWQTFVKLDSSRFPMTGFGDPFHRLFGRWTRNFINVIQALQQFLTVCILIFGQSSILSQMAQAKICWIAVMIIITVVGIAMAWLRSLKHLGWLCNASVWINVVTFIIVCAGAAKYGPDATITVQSTLLPKAWLTDPAPVKTFFTTPPALYQQNTPNPANARLQGVNNMVYSYSGAILFNAFLSEMRRPMDFWKATVLAQTFITVVYIFFGIFVYAFYGQYSASTITQNLKPLGLQYVANALSLITGFLAIFLYFNIGFKTVYIEVGQEILHFPPITTKKGRWLWVAIGPIYWILALCFAASIPSFNGIVGVVGSLFSLNFTYSIPAIAYFVYLLKEGARLPGEGFNPRTGETTRHDEGVRRLARGFMNKWYLATPVLLYACGGLAASGLGTWSAILSLEGLLGPGGTIQTSWGCTALG